MTPEVLLYTVPSEFVFRPLLPGRKCDEAIPAIRKCAEVWLQVLEDVDPETDDQELSTNTVSAYLLPVDSSLNISQDGSTDEAFKRSALKYFSGRLWYTRTTRRPIRRTILKGILQRGRLDISRSTRRQPFESRISKIGLCAESKLCLNSAI